MSGHGEKWSRKYEQAIVALLQHPTIGEAASAIGISEATLWRWLQLAEFQARYREARRLAVNQAIAQVQRITAPAVTTLDGVMTSKTASPASRVAAARTVVEMALRAVELDDIEARVAALEAVARNQERSTPHAITRTPARPPRGRDPAA
jgi:hypothetical protein